ncbi:hypothetical protein CEXT_382021 [Caerostris extrusa]|uniref:Uncharacterized protein n=1 Tax=Caerostris extrusa TaxID=172846 RepID=A0AAV4TJG3_CAEEX|nr:hypothetical protein CEXT_382021 [Caerostris extrusa]
MCELKTLAHSSVSDFNNRQDLIESDFKESQKKNSCLFKKVSRLVPHSNIDVAFRVTEDSFFFPDDISLALLFFEKFRFISSFFRLMHVQQGEIIR